ncbi:DUF192 domain-containing protein [Aliiroseovarius sp. PTFE2010]
MLLPAVAVGQECRVDRVSLRGAFGTAHFRVEVADDAAERAQGLMHRDSLSATAGMLFVYPEPGRVAFWMRNTQIPLDLVFADESGRVTRVHHRAIPFDETPIDGGDGVSYVLEINGGMAAALGLDIGDELRHPDIRQTNAAWACD